MSRLRIIHYNTFSNIKISFTNKIFIILWQAISYDTTLQPLKWTGCIHAYAYLKMLSQSSLRYISCRNKVAEWYVLY